MTKQTQHPWGPLLGRRLKRGGELLATNPLLLMPHVFADHSGHSSIKTTTSTTNHHTSQNLDYGFLKALEDKTLLDGNRKNNLTKKERCVTKQTVPLVVCNFR